MCQSPLSFHGETQSPNKDLCQPNTMFAFEGVEREREKKKKKRSVVLCWVFSEVFFNQSSSSITTLV